MMCHATQVLHGETVVCKGRMKAYEPETMLAKEHVPMSMTKELFLKAGADALGVDPCDEQYEALSEDDWYALCARQHLEYGPKFRMVKRYAVDRSWTELRCATTAPSEIRIQNRLQRT